MTTNTTQRSATRFLTAIAVGLLAVTAGAQTWTFDSGATEGWQVITVPGSTNWSSITNTWAASSSSSGGAQGGGATDGYIWAIDNAGSDAFGFEKTVAGGFGAYNGGTLNFSLQCEGNDWGGDRTVALVGNGKTILANFSTAPGTTWTPISIGLTPGNFSYDSTSGSGLVTDFPAILANLTSIRISAEYQTSSSSGPFERTGLDRVSFSTIPEPATTAALFGAAALLVAGLARSRRQR